MAFPKVQGLTAKFKNRFLGANYFSYVAWIVFYLYQMESKWPQESHAMRQFAQAITGVGMFWFYFGATMVAPAWLHWPAWKDARKPWLWIVFVGAIHCFLCFKHLYIHTVLYLEDRHDITTLMARPIIQVFSIVDMVLFGLVMFKVLIWDTVRSYMHNLFIRRDPFYVMVYVMLMVLVPLNLIYLLSKAIHSVCNEF